ncbi:MAG: threonine/serine exporter ThrE family protein [Planctomycetota bacterium]
MSKHAFVVELGRAMHALGSPAYRVEDSMVACSRALGMEGSFFATPTAIFLAVGEPGEEARTTLLRVVPGDHDLGRLAALYRIRDCVVRHELSVEDGLQELRAVLAASGPRAWVDVVGQLLIGGGAAALLGGGGNEVLVASLAGLLVGCIGLLARRRPSLGDVQAALTCAVAAFFVRAMAVWWQPIDVPVTTIAAIIVLLPGLSFTTALAELAIRHLAAGSARLMGAIAVFVTMAIGVGIGDRVASELCGDIVVGPAEVLGVGWLVVALCVTWVAFVLLLRGTLRQAPWVLLAIAAGFGGARLGSAILGSELGPVVGAMAVALLGNLHSRWLRAPAAIVRTPGLLLLVPGSLGLSGLTTAISGEFSESAPFVFRMILVGGSIVAGVLFAGVILPPPLEVEPSPIGLGLPDRPPAKAKNKAEAHRR